MKLTIPEKEKLEILNELKLKLEKERLIIEDFS